MKYLKTFEGRTQNPIRKYVVLKNEGDAKLFENNCLLIYQVCRTKNKIMDFVHMTLNLKYIYLIDEDRVISQRARNHSEYKLINNYLIYTSDDLEDIKVKLPILVSSIKFNL